MSSVNWMKMTRQRAGSMKVHLDDKERMEHEHSNVHIDKSLSHLNSVIGCESYQQALDRMNDRTKTVDAIQPPKRRVKDRVVACMLEVPCPLEIQEQGKDAQFFEVMYKEMQQYFGAENVHGAFIHRDEQHEYTGKDGQEYTSLYHAHVMVSAYTADKGINGKAFETRARLKEFNDIVNKACEREFGIELNTHGLAGHQSVEYLKKQEEYNQVTGDLIRSQEGLEQNIQDAAYLQQRLEIKRDEYQREIDKRERIGKTWTGKAKDNITVNKEGYERALNTCKDFDDIEARQQRKQKELDKKQKRLDQQRQEQEQRQQEQDQRQQALNQQQRDLELLIQQQVDQRTKNLTDELNQYKTLAEQNIYQGMGKYRDNEYFIGVTFAEIVDICKEYKTIPAAACNYLINTKTEAEQNAIDQKLNKSLTQSVTQTKTYVRSRDDDFER